MFTASRSHAFSLDPSPRRRGSAMQAEMAEEKFSIVSNLQRKPSMLSVLEPISENALYRRLVSSISWSSSPSEELEDRDRNRGVLSWGRQEVADWLVQIGMKQYQVVTYSKSAADCVYVAGRCCLKNMVWTVGVVYYN